MKISQQLLKTMWELGYGDITVIDVTGKETIYKKESKKYQCCNQWFDTVKDFEIHKDKDCKMKGWW